MATKIKITWVRGQETGKATLKIKCNSPTRKMIQEAIRNWNQKHENRGKVVTIDNS